MMESKCTLSDKQLIAVAHVMVGELSRTGGRAWTMRVPVDFDRDHDMIFNELIGRFDRAVSKLFPDSETAQK